MSPKELPDCSGIYGIYLPSLEQWFYIGKAQNISSRLKGLFYPFHIAESLAVDKSYFYIPAT